MEEEREKIGLKKKDLLKIEQSKKGIVKQLRKEWGESGYLG